MDSTVSLSNSCSAGIGNVLVTITSLIRLFLSRSTASPLKMPCVAAMTTSVAPSSKSSSAALVIEPAVSIMSSISRQQRPATSPTTRFATTSLAASMLRLLWTNAISRPPSSSAHCSAVRTRPVSGETMTRSCSPYFSRTCSESSGIANRWSTGPSKKPWICAVCRSTAINRSAPAVLNRSAISRAEIGSRPRCFLSCRA